MGSGKVLVAGGITNNPLTPPTPPCYNTTVCFPLVATNTTEVFDPATGAWTMGPSMPYNRASQFQVLLPDGKVFISGGTGEGPRLLCGCSRAPGGCCPARVCIAAVVFVAEGDMHLPEVGRCLPNSPCGAVQATRPSPTWDRPAWTCPPACCLIQRATHSWRRGRCRCRLSAPHRYCSESEGRSSKNTQDIFQESR